MATSIGDEGGFAPNLESHKAALKLPGRDAAMQKDARFILFWLPPADHQLSIFDHDGKIRLGKGIVGKTKAGIGVNAQDFA